VLGKYIDIKVFGENIYRTAIFYIITALLRASSLVSVTGVPRQVGELILPFSPGSKFHKNASNIEA
jgi:hypothetical protein